MGIAFVHFLDTHQRSLEVVAEGTVSYQKELKKHLADYKRRDLGITKAGTFLYRGREVERDHILPTKDRDRNLFEEALPAAMAFFKANSDKRHRYFHHLNSSQAFAFNLFFPYFDGGPEAASVLLRALGRDGVLVEWKPEEVPVPDEESNIDMLWTTEDGTRTFCEIKLSEADFGKATNDPRHCGKLRQHYADVLDGHLEPSRLEPLAFFGAYQFNRNVWHMVRADRNRLIFLLPRANSVLWSLLDQLLLGVVPQTRDRISKIAIEDVIAKLSLDNRRPDSLREYPEKLKRKYCPDCLVKENT